MNDQSRSGIEEALSKLRACVVADKPHATRQDMILGSMAWLKKQKPSAVRDEMIADHCVRMAKEKLRRHSTAHQADAWIKEANLWRHKSVTESYDTRGSGERT